MDVAADRSMHLGLSDAAGVFVAMLWSITFLTPEIRPVGYGLIVLLTIGFVQNETGYALNQ